MEEKLHLQFCIVHSKQLQRQSCSWLCAILTTYQAYKKHHHGLKRVYMCAHIAISPSRELLCFLESL